MTVSIWARGSSPHDGRSDSAGSPFDGVDVCTLDGFEEHLVDAPLASTLDSLVHWIHRLGCLERISRGFCSHAQIEIDGSILTGKICEGGSLNEIERMNAPPKI